jgi:hypothetical protein
MKGLGPKQKKETGEMQPDCTSYANQLHKCQAFSD